MGLRGGGEMVWQYREHGITDITFFDGRVVRRFKANIKALDVFYKSISAFIF
jgi:hypothetical protein